MRDDQANGSGQRPEESGPESNTPGQDHFAGDDLGEAADAAVPPADSPSSADPTFGQPTFGRPSYGQSSYGASSFGQPGYGHPSYGQESYGQPGYGAGQPGYGATQPGAAGYGHPGFGQTMPFGYGGGYGQPGYLPQSNQGARRRRSFLTYLIVAVVAAAAGAGVTAYFAGSPGSSNVSSNPQAGSGNTGIPNLPTGPSGNSGRVSTPTEQAVYKAVSPGLVDISSNLQYQGSQAAATGMVISSNGLVLTNNHVIADTTQLFATVVTTHQRYRAKWLGYDATDDVAVIKLINARNLKTVPLGNSSAVKVGQDVVAMGNAGGAGHVTPATGTITGLDKTITASDAGAASSETLHGMLQTDAGIIQGDSGGALANTSGRVIGMNTAAATGNFNAQNMGFAIPINKALAIASKIIHGQASKTIQIGSTGFMGVLVPAGHASLSSNPQQQRQRQLRQDESDSGFPVQPSSPSCLANDLTAGVPNPIAPVSSGALIIGELCGTPADRAGIIAGDVIVAVGKDKVSSPSHLTQVMLGFRPGDKVQVTWVDIHGATHHTSLRLIQAPPH
jgi:S1-C subfamily serine protease